MTSTFVRGDMVISLLKKELKQNATIVKHSIRICECSECVGFGHTPEMASLSQNGCP